MSQDLIFLCTVCADSLSPQISAILFSHFIGKDASLRKTSTRTAQSISKSWLANFPTSRRLLIWRNHHLERAEDGDDRAVPYRGRTGPTEFLPTFALPVSVKKHSSYVSLGHATQQQKLQSSPRFGVFKADFPTGLLIRRSVFSQTPVCR